MSSVQGRSKAVYNRIVLKLSGEVLHSSNSAIDREIREVSFNRNGFVFGGNIRALADAAREAGLKF